MNPDEATPAVTAITRRHFFASCAVILSQATRGRFSSERVTRVSDEIAMRMQLFEVFE